MKNLVSFIKEQKIKPWESDTGKFAEHFKYSKDDFYKFMKATEDELAFHLADGLCLIFKEDDHVATYDQKKEEIWTDDIALFGHEIEEAKAPYILRYMTNNDRRTIDCKSIEDAIKKVPVDYVNYEILDNGKWNFSEPEALVQWDGDIIFWKYRLENPEAKKSEKDIINNKNKSLR